MEVIPIPREVIEALKFYASETTWNYNRFPDTPGDKDGGERARKALDGFAPGWDK